MHVQHPDQQVLAWRGEHVEGLQHVQRLYLLEAARSAKRAPVQCSGQFSGGWRGLSAWSQRIMRGMAILLLG
jgi:hypothetical protein